jgi:hypothetical protein
MNNRIIYDCYIGPPVFGIITAEDSLQRRAIFAEQLKNLIGFRTYIPELTHEKFTFYEVGYFMELLYKGSPEAFTMLNINEDFVEQSSAEIRILKDVKDNFISKAIPTYLLGYCKGVKDTMLEEESFFNDEKSIKKLDYNKNTAYICNLYLRIAKDVLLFSEFRVDREDAKILTAIKDGMFSKETIIKEIEEQTEEVEKLLKESNLPAYPSKDFINETLFKIRGIDHIEETTKIR